MTTVVTLHCRSERCSLASPIMSAQRTGTADLPLHGGHVPRWLADRMTTLGGLIAETIVLHYGRRELLRRLAHPFWFQSFGAVMGMDWHSSGITTSVIGSLKRALAPRARDLGVYVCGGRGAHSRRTPGELLTIGERVGLDGDALARTSRLVAKVDSAAVQDGFDLYLHGFIVSDDGAWTVVQQGMSPLRRQARRYHWSSEDLTSFVEAPHRAIEGRPGGDILNLTDPRARDARVSGLMLATGDPAVVIDTLARMPSALPAGADGQLHLVLPKRHDVRPSDVLMRRLDATLAAVAAHGPTDFPDLLLVPGVGARTVAALAMVAEVVHGAPARFADPARYSLALGGKDGHPFPVPLAVYDETLRVLTHAVGSAKLGRDEKLAALRRLDCQARRIEAAATVH